MSTFQVSVNAEGILLLTGELNYAAITAELWEQSKALLAAAPTPIRIDLSGVTHSDSTGVAFLVGWVRQAKKLKKTINLLHIPEQMRAIIRVSGLEDLLPVG